MVRYYGRARQRIGAVNTNQLGLKMSGCPSRVGRNPVNARYISHRVNCMNGTCGPIMVHGVPYFPNNLRNKAPYCRVKTTTCQAAAGGVGHINTPYYRTPAPGEKGCGCKFGPCGSPGRPGVSGQFTLKAGTAAIDELPVVGFITPTHPNPSYPSFGIINFEDSSPINKNDILVFIQAENCSLFPPEDDFPPCGIATSFQLTPATHTWLLGKIYADGVEDPEDGIPSFILNINGKQYKNVGINTSSDEELLTAFFAPITELDTIEIEDGEFYDFSFS